MMIRKGGQRPPFLYGSETMNLKLRNMTSLYLVRDDGVLCLFRVGSRVANNKYVGSAGGHFEDGELNDPLRCILREMWEELNLEENDLEEFRLRYVTHRLVSGEIRQNYYYFAKLKEDRTLCSTEGTLRWVPWEELALLEMPISAKHMMDHYQRKGRFTEELYGGITEETGTKFVIMRDF